MPFLTKEKENLFSIVFSVFNVFHFLRFRRLILDEFSLFDVILLFSDVNFVLPFSCFFIFISLNRYRNSGELFIIEAKPHFQPAVQPKAFRFYFEAKNLDRKDLNGKSGLYSLKIIIILKDILRGSFFSFPFPFPQKRF